MPSFLVKVNAVPGEPDRSCCRLADLGPPVDQLIIERAAAICALLSDPARLRLLVALPARIDSRLASWLGMGEGELAGHLAALTDAGLVVSLHSVAHLHPEARKVIGESLRVLFDPPECGS